MCMAQPIRLLVTCLILFVFSSIYRAEARNYSIVLHNTETGLVGNRVNEITQDKSGVIWVATNNGVSAFDGINYTNYTSKNGLAEGICSTIFIDSKNQVWVGHQGSGISLITKDSIVVFTEANGLVNNEVNDILEAKDGKIWVATFGGISVYDGTSWVNTTTSQGLILNNTTSLAQYTDGTIWAGSYGAGVNIIDGRRISQLHLGNGLVNNYVTSLVNRNGHMIVGTLGGLSDWDGSKFVANENTEGLFSNQINAITTDANGQVWLATFNGAVRLNEDENLVLSQFNGLPQNEVLDAFVDAENNLWLSSKDGLARVGSLAFQQYVSTEETEVYPTCVFVDSKDNVWIGNEGGGVLTLDGDEIIPALDDPDINDQNISAIVEDADGNIWFGTSDFGGLFQYDGKQVYIYSDEFGLADNNTNCFAVSQDGILFIGTPNGLSTFDGMGFEIVYISDEFATNYITALEALPDGSILIGSKDGAIHQYKDGEVSRVESINTSSWITSISVIEGGFAVSTKQDGIYVSSNGKTTHISDQHGLQNSAATAVFEHNNKLYVAGINSIHQFTISSDTLLGVRLGQPEGYFGGTCIASAVDASNGTFYIGTEKGVTTFKPSELNVSAQAPKTELTELQLSYDSVNWAELGFVTLENSLPKELILPYTENNLRFFFRGINHQNPKGVSYKWKLEGYEKEWTPLNNQAIANYPSLPPGDYTLQVVACNADGVCSEDATTFSFVIKPPFWRTLWFYVLLSAAIIGLTIFFVKRRERVLKEEKEILEATVQERTKELREQKEIVEHQNQHITESIEYASNIQKAILPSEEELNAAFTNHFVFYRPKETVGGDFYWAYHNNGISWAAAVDCTGHGVAGAFMSMIGSDLLNQIIIEKQEQDPAKVLDALDKGIKLAFAQSEKEFESDQGMDLVLIRVDRKKKEIAFAGAQRPLFLWEENELKEIEGDLISISNVEQMNAEPFSTKKHTYKEGAIAYLFSDGIVDQFGGPKGKKFMVRRMREFIQNHANKAVEVQATALTQTFDDWRGSDNPQLDDVMLLGIQL